MSGRLFEDFKTASIVAIGWSAMGNMGALKTRDDFVRAVVKAWPDSKRMQGKLEMDAG